MIARLLLLGSAFLLRSRYPEAAIEVEKIRQALGNERLFEHLLPSISKPSIPKSQVALPQLFQTHAEWLKWAYKIPDPDKSTREGARIATLLISENRTDVLDGIRLARESGKWDVWTRKVLFPNPNHLSQELPHWEELLREGVKTARFDSNFNPITYMAISNWPWHDKLLRSLLDLLLSIGAEINDEDLNGLTLLDRYVGKSSVVVDDVGHLLALGAIPHPRMIDVLRSSGSTTAPDCIALLEAALRKPKLEMVAQDVRPDITNEVPRRAF